MTSSRRAAFALGILLLLAAIAVGAASLASRHGDRSVPERREGERPKLLVLTSLPILFPEEFTLDAPASPVLDALQKRYSVVPISVTDEATLEQGSLLLAAHPQAQPGEYLVTLDKWVRAGGHVLLLADPALRWPSERPLGDKLRPPLAFADTGLLKRWGLRLDAPEHLGREDRSVDGSEIATVAPGTLVALGNSCKVADEGLVARCTIGRGQVRVVADADFLAVDSIVGADHGANLGLLLSQLAALKY